VPATAPPARTGRFDGLDRMRGVALLFMLLHHLLSWTKGGVRARPVLGWIDDMAITDLAAPMFAMGAGAAAVLVGGRRPVGDWSGFRAGARRWAVIAGWGVLIGISTDGDLDSFGVLESLAVAGVVLSALLVVHRPTVTQWLGLAVLATAAAPLVLEHVRLGETPGPVALVDAVAGTFPVVSYLALALWGATVAAALGREERPLALLGLAAVAAAAFAAWIATGHDGWSPDRGPAILPFLLPGVVATLGLWAVVAWLPTGRITNGFARAGTRTLPVFVGHYAIRLVIDTGGWLGTLDGPVWTGAAVAAAVGIFVVAALPRRTSRAGGLDPEPAGKRGSTVGLVPSHG
jgi:uncharacterized membrane protein